MKENEVFIKNSAKKRKLKILRFFIIVIAIALLGSIVYAVSASKTQNNQADNVDLEKSPLAKVKTVSLGSESALENKLVVSGVVKPSSQVDVIALANATVRDLFFEVGDMVEANQLLVRLHDSAVLTNLNTSQTGYNNLLNSLSNTQNVANESVRQAEISVASVRESIESAKIGVKTAEDNLKNGQALISKNKIDKKNNAVVAFNDNLNLVQNSLNQINYIIKAEGGSQLPGISDTLGVLNGQSLIFAKSSYLSAKTNLASLKIISPNSENILDSLIAMNSVFSSFKTAIDDAIFVLDNTIANPNFSEVSLQTQKNSFSSLRSGILSAQTTALTHIQTLQNLDLNAQQDLDSLSNALSSARNQLNLAEIAYSNALASLESAKQNRNQQILSAQISLDSARGQLSLSQTQAADLNVQAPISGVVTAKYIELGSEVSPGQKVAQISKADLVKIEIDLPGDQISGLRVGQSVVINSNLEGFITKINPSADPISRKVRVEVSFDNQSGDLIAETFVDVSMVKQENISGQGGIWKIPLSAVTIGQQESFVFVVEEDIAKKRVVNLGGLEGDKVLVTFGLEKGDMLIMEGNKDLSDQDRVELIK